MHSDKKGTYKTTPDKTFQTKTVGQNPPDKTPGTKTNPL